MAKTPSAPAEPRHFHHLYEVDGKLALYSGSRRDSHCPVAVHTYHVSDIPARDWPEVLGCRVANWGWSGNGNLGTCYLGNGRTVTVDTTGWWPVTFDVSVPKPRDGREYTWVWRGGFTPEWIKDYFPRCGHCDRYHNPEFTHCEGCGKAHKEGGKHVCD